MLVGPAANEANGRDNDNDTENQLYEKQNQVEPGEEAKNDKKSAFLLD